VIRKAKLEDIDELMPLFRVAHQNTMFKNTSFNEWQIRRMLSFGVCMPNFFCEVVEHKGKIVGVMGGGVDKNVWGCKIASDVIFYSTRSTDKLLKRFHIWAEEQDAEMVNITSLVVNERYDNLLMKLGYKKAGQVFAREV